MPTKDMASYDPVPTPALTDEHIIRTSGNVTYNKTTQQILNNLYDTTAKTTLAAADTITIIDSAASNVAKKITFANALVAFFSGLTGKTTPVDADTFTIADSAASNAGKNLTWANLKATLLSADGIGSAVNGYTAKTTPVDADVMLLSDSADTNDAKKVTWANVKATIKAYTDTLYAAVGSPYTAATMGDFIVGLTGKTTPVDADTALFSDSAASDDAKKVTWANVKATLKTYNDTLYVGIDGGAALHTKIIEIGDWNMDSTGDVSVAHGLTFGNIRSIQVLIRNDANQQMYPIDFNFLSTADAGYYFVNDTNISLTRTPGGTFDSTSFDSTSYNRGWVTITYV